MWTETSQIIGMAGLWRKVKVYGPRKDSRKVNGHITEFGSKAELHDEEVKVEVSSVSEREGSLSP